MGYRFLDGDVLETLGVVITCVRRSRASFIDARIATNKMGGRLGDIVCYKICYLQDVVA